jgi:hypothetical protein
MAIHEFGGMDTHVVCLVGWIAWAIFLFGWMRVDGMRILD